MKPFANTISNSPNNGNIADIYDVCIEGFMDFIGGLVGGRGRSRTHQPPYQQLNGFEGRTPHRGRRSSINHPIR